MEKYCLLNGIFICHYLPKNEIDSFLEKKELKT